MSDPVGDSSDPAASELPASSEERVREEVHGAEAQGPDERDDDRARDPVVEHHTIAPPS